MRPIIAHRGGPDRQRRGHWCVLLAAGGSRRLGRPKQFVDDAGMPLVRRACLRALATRPAGVVVVTGAHGARVRAALAVLPVACVHRRDWRGGLAVSLRAGLARVPRFAPVALVLLVDQWRVGAHDLERLLRGRAPAAARHGAAVGAPAALTRPWRAKARGLHGDRGLGGLLGGGSVRAVEIPAAAFDLDVPADRAHLRRRGTMVTGDTAPRGR